MENKTKSKDALGITDLIGQITKKQNSGELGKTDKQHVISVNEQKHENTETQKHINTEIVKRKNTEVQKREKSITGRPSMKDPDIEYVRISATIPKALKKKMGNAIVNEVFQTENGYIRTVDELVTYAVEKLLTEK